MNIDIKDYLTPEEIKDVCQNALYQKIREDMRGLNVYDIIANISHSDVDAMVDDMLDEVDCFQPSDVAPVVHGRWMPFHSEAAGDIQYCSACEIGFDAKTDYCPNCGAKMDGGTDDAVDGNV